MSIAYFGSEVCEAYKKFEREYAIKRTWWEKLLGFCPWCGRYFQYSVKTARRNTAYVDDASNWITACKRCRNSDHDYFEELWKDYYSGCL